MTTSNLKLIAAAFFAVMGLVAFGATAVLALLGFIGMAILIMIVELIVTGSAVMAGVIVLRDGMEAEIERERAYADAAIAAHDQRPPAVMPEDLADSHAALMAVLQSAGHNISDALRMSSQLNTDMGELGSHFADIEDERAFLRKRVAHLDMFVETARQGAQREAPVRQPGNGVAPEPEAPMLAYEAAEPFSEGPLPSYLTRPVDLDDHRGPEAFAPLSVRSRGLDALKAELMGGTAKTAEGKS